MRANIQKKAIHLIQMQQNALSADFAGRTQWPDLTWTQTFQRHTIDQLEDTENCVASRHFLHDSFAENRGMSIVHLISNKSEG